MSESFVQRVARRGLLVGVGVLAVWGGDPAWAIQPKSVNTPLEAREFYLPELYISSSQVPIDEIVGELPNRAAWERFLGQRDEGPDYERVSAFIDPRSGAATNLISAFALIPGDGVGNRVTLQSLGARLGRSVDAVDAQTVAEAVMDFARAHADVLGIDVNQLGPVRATHVSDELWNVVIPQEAGGVRVRGAMLAGTINNGNLVIFGTEGWGNVTIRTRPSIDAAQALEAGFEYAGGRSLFDRMAQDPQLEIVPVSPQEHLRGEAFAGPIGAGYRHRLVWSFRFQRGDEDPTWEALVDAHSGEVIAFEDKNSYANATISGGVYPLTSTGICPNAQQCGTMQSNWPMPWTNTGFASPNNYTNSGGVYTYTSGTATTTNNGRYIRTTDTCGTLSASSATGSINLGGTNNQHDCTTPGTGGAGNTPASRSGFYELNKIKEQARGWLPGNAWLSAQLTANMNIASTCNAYWNGSTVNFYRSGGGCRNTGEIAAVFDHEWGHGIDDNDANGIISSSGEAYADIASIYRLQASCVGHGFFWTSNRGCGTTVDGTGYNQNEAQVGAAHCDTDCSGVRDADYLKHSPNTPDTALGFVCSSCSASSGLCGRQTHCAGTPVRQMAWDLVARDLTAAPFSLDSQTSFLIGNRLFYLGSGTIGSWHSCTCGSTSTGCGSTNGYMTWLAADDTNGNISDGTPHMTAIYNAYNRHGIACSTPARVNSGCTAPAAPTTLTVTPGSARNTLSWTAVAGASRYWVLRTEGHAGCNFGKVKLAEVTTTSYVDTTVRPGRTYYYNVVTQASSAACFSRVSTCVSGVPTAAPEIEPRFGADGE
jgi:hypothetical protein